MWGDSFILFCGIATTIAVDSYIVYTYPMVWNWDINIITFLPHIDILVHVVLPG